MALGQLIFSGSGVSIGTEDSKIAQIKIYRATVDFASAIDGADVGANVTCTGVALGDVVMGVSVDVDAGDDVLITGQPTATDTVRLTFFNRSGGTIDLASTTATIVVLKRG